MWQLNWTDLQGICMHNDFFRRNVMPRVPQKRAFFHFKAIYVLFWAKVVNSRLVGSWKNIYFYFQSLVDLALPITVWQAFLFTTIRLEEMGEWTLMHTKLKFWLYYMEGIQLWSWNLTSEFKLDFRFREKAQFLCEEFLLHSYTNIFPMLIKRFCRRRPAILSHMHDDRLSAVQSLCGGAVMTRCFRLPFAVIYEIN